jgi:hypothetical protein
VGGQAAWLLRGCRPRTRALSPPTSKQRPWRRRTSSPGRNATPTGSNARRIGPATAGRGARRSASKSSIALALTVAADASFATDQPSRARAERHWAAEIIALGRASKVRKWAIAITACVSRHPHNRFRLDRISSAICPRTNKGVVKPGYRSIRGARSRNGASMRVCHPLRRERPPV